MSWKSNLIAFPFNCHVGGCPALFFDLRPSLLRYEFFISFLSGAVSHLALPGGYLAAVH